MGIHPLANLVGQRVEVTDRPDSKPRRFIVAHLDGAYLEVARRGSCSGREARASYATVRPIGKVESWSIKGLA